MSFQFDPAQHVSACVSSSFLETVPETVRCLTASIDLEVEAASIRFETTEMRFVAPTSSVGPVEPVKYGINNHNIKTNSADNNTYQPQAVVVNTAMSQ